MQHAGQPTLAGVMFALALVTAVACVSVPRTLEITTSASLRSNLAAGETEQVLRLAEAWLKSTNEATGSPNMGNLRRMIVTSVQADEPMLFIGGCGTLTGSLLPERSMVLVMAVRHPSGWQMHSWEVQMTGLHGEVVPCGWY